MVCTFKEKLVHEPSLSLIPKQSPYVVCATNMQIATLLSHEGPVTAKSNIQCQHTVEPPIKDPRERDNLPTKGTLLDT